MAAPNIVPVPQGISTPQTDERYIDLSASGSAAPAPAAPPALGAAAGTGTDADKGAPFDPFAAAGFAPPAPQGAPAATAPSAAASDHGAPFDPFAVAGFAPPAPSPVNAPRASNDAGMTANIGASANRAVADFLGAPVDALHWLATHDPISALGQALGASPTGIFGYSPAMQAAQQQPWLGGSQSIGTAMGLLAGQNPYAVQPQTPGERIAANLTEGAIGALMPWGAARALPAASAVVAGLRDTFGAGSALGNAASGAASSAAAQAIQDHMPGWVPDWMRPVVTTAAGMLGGAAPVVAGHAIGTVAGGIGAMAAKATTPLGIGKSADLTNPETGEAFTEPTTGEAFRATPAQVKAVGARIAGNANMAPADLAAHIDQRAATADGLPGAQPSMGQLTGNLGLLGRERELQTLNRAPFTAAQAAHKVAQATALKGLAGEDAQASAMSDFVTSTHTRLREAHDAALRADGSADAMLGSAGTQHPADTGTAMAAQVNAHVAPTFAAADTALRQAQEKLHAAMEVLRKAGADPLERQIAGGRVQQALAALDDARKDFVSKLYAVVDPDGTKMLPTAGLRNAARAIVRDMAPMATPITAEEAHLFKFASSLPDAVPFKDLQVFRSEVGEMRRAMRRGGPNAPAGERALARVTALANAIDRTTVDAVEAAVKADPKAAQAVGEQVEEAAKAQVAEAVAQHAAQNSASAGQSESVIGQRLAQEAADFAAARRGQTATARAGGSVGTSDAGASTAGMAPGISGAPGTKGQAGRRSGSAAGNTGIPGEERPTVEAPKPNWTAADAAAFRLANAEHRERVQVFRGEGGNDNAVGAVLKRGSDRDTFRMAASEVGPRLFNGGKRQAEDAQSFVRAIGGKTDAEVQAEFRRRAVDADGAFDPAKFAQMMQARHAAMDGLTDYLIGDFRAAAERNGQIDPVRAATWLEDRKAALASFPDVAQRLGSVAKLSAAAKALQAARAALDKTHPLAGVGEAGKLPGRYWTAGPAGADRIAQYARHTGGSPEAMALLDDHAMSTLRAEAWKNGQWSNSGFAAWEKKYAPALAARPDLAAKVRTVQSAQNAITEASAQRAQAVTDFQNSAARFWIGTDPAKAVTRMLASRDPVGDAQQIMRMTRGDPAAQAGVRKAFADWLVNRVAETSEAGTTGVKGPGKAMFQRLFEANPPAANAFRTVLGEDAMHTVRSVSENMDMQARAWNATKIHGSPGSAADTEAIRKDARLPFIAQMFGAEFIGKLAEELTGATGLTGIVVGGAAGAAGLVANALRSAGMQNMRDLEAAALLDPHGLGKLVLEHASTPQARERLAQRLARRLSQLAAQQLINRTSQP